MKTDQALIELSRASSKVAALTRAIGEAMKCSYEAQTANGGTYRHCRISAPGTAMMSCCASSLAASVTVSSK